MRGFRDKNCIVTYGRWFYQRKKYFRAYKFRERIRMWQLSIYHDRNGDWKRVYNVYLKNTLTEEEVKKYARKILDELDIS